MIYLFILFGDLSFKCICLIIPFHHNGLLSLFIIMLHIRLLIRKLCDVCEPWNLKNSFVDSISLQEIRKYISLLSYGKFEFWTHWNMVIYVYGNWFLVPSDMTWLWTWKQWFFFGYVNYIVYIYIYIYM